MSHLQCADSEALAAREPDAMVTLTAEPWIPRKAGADRKWLR